MELTFLLVQDFIKLCSVKYDKLDFFFLKEILAGVKTFAHIKVGN